MYTLNDISITPVFDITGTTQKIKLQWLQASGAIASSSVDVIVTAIKDPFGNTIYSNLDWNSPDLTGAIPSVATEVDIVDIPNDINSKPIEGAYSLEYSVRFYDNISAVTTGAGGTFTTTSKPASFFSGMGTIEVIDSTGNDGTYIVASAVEGTGVITVDAGDTISSAVADGKILYGGLVVGTLDSNSTHTFELSDTDVQLELPYNCLTETIELIDKTKYLDTYTITSKTQTLYYPSVLNKTPITSTSLTKNLKQTLTGDLWTTNWEGSLSFTFEFYVNNEENETIIRQTLSNSINQTVVCDYDLCKLICCLEDYRKAFNAYKGQNPSIVYSKAPQLAQLAFLMQEAEIAKNCNKQDIFASVQQNLKDLLNTIDDCNCTGCNDQTTEPQKVVGIANASTLLSVEQEGSGAITTSVSKIVFNDRLNVTDNGNGSVTVKLQLAKYKYSPNGTSTIPAPELAGKTINDCIFFHGTMYIDAPAIAANGDLTFSFVPTAQIYVVLFN